MVRDLLAKYTDDKQLIEETDILLRYFSVVENEAELVSWPMEYFINLPYITIEMCQLIDKIQRNEEQQIKEWEQNNEDLNNRIEKTNMIIEKFSKNIYDEGLPA